jgi:hypothetical protein
MKKKYTFKKGDLITTYYEGIFSFIRYKKRSGKSSPLVYSKIVFHNNGCPTSSKEIYECDAGHCGRAEDFILKRLSNLKSEKKRFLEILLNQYKK